MSVSADRVKPLLIYGAGGHGLVVAEAALRAGHEVAGFLDDRLEPGTKVGPLAVLGRADQATEYDAQVIVAIGDNHQRWDRMEHLTAAGVELGTVAHPSAQVSESAVMEPGVFVGPAAVVNAEARVGPAAVINSGAIVEHHGRIDAAAHVGPGAVLAGRVHVGTRSLIGARAVVLPGVIIGPDVVVGAGAVVTRDVEAGRTVVGNPASSP